MAPPKAVRKKDVTAYYKKRSELTADDAEQLFCKNEILSLTDDKYNDVSGLVWFWHYSLI
jgi:hypothetical protein